MWIFGGPFHTMPVDGFKYFMTIVDDYSHFTWIYLVRTKAKAQVVIPQFFELVSNQFDKVIKVVWSDNAKELNLTSFYTSKGVISYHSCIEQPEQNSVVERKHQHLLNVARALIFQSGLPLIYWPDSILTAVYLIVGF